ncbi:hypothetical protein D5086_022042 [Populus alba]|uniref:Uncharacterized protein n=1 Tax=Populus alba TaxID=43335 RepID=A0ACC4BFD0_POPAL
MAMRATTAALAAAAAAPRGGFLRLFSTTSTSSSSFPFPQATQQTPAREQAEPNTNLFCEWMDSRKLRWREVSVRVVIVLDVGEKGGAKTKMRIGRQCSCAGIAGLSKRTTSEGLREAFSKFGEVVQARVVTDRVSGYSKGFGFVKYATLEDAAEGIKGMDGQSMLDPDNHLLNLKTTQAWDYGNSATNRLWQSYCQVSKISIFSAMYAGSSIGYRVALKIRWSLVFFRGVHKQDGTGYCDPSLFRVSSVLLHSRKTDL